MNYKKCECPEHDCHNPVVVRVERKLDENNYTILDLCGGCELPNDTFIEWLNKE